MTEKLRTNTLISFLHSYLLILMTLGAVGLSGCDFGIEKRPYGYIKIGKVSDLLAPETNFKDFGLFLRHDSGGFSVMSTYCTSDLSHLELRQSPQGEIWKSPWTQSSYSKDGKVLTAPAKRDLPYYELELNSGEYGGPRDTLYVKVGSEMPKEWRLQVPGS